MENQTLVLLIDDDEALGHATSDLLILLGFDVIWKADRADAVDALCSRHQFHVVLLDLRLGDERGEQVISEARSQGYSIPPIVILSGQPDAELRDAARVIQAKAILRKPCTARDMQSAIERAIA
jgi:DNA-binding response OmpR family regulator